MSKTYSNLTYMGLLNAKHSKKIEIVQIIDYYETFSKSDAEIMLGIWLYFNNLFDLRMSIMQAQSLWNNQLEHALNYAITWLNNNVTIKSSKKITLQKNLIKVSTHYKFIL